MTVACNVVQLDEWQPRHMRKYSGWVSCDGYVVTDPLSYVVDVFEDRSWRKLGSHLLPPSLRPSAYGPREDFCSGEARMDRWWSAIEGLRLYSDYATWQLRYRFEPPPRRRRRRPDPSQLELDIPLEPQFPWIPRRPS